MAGEEGLEPSHAGIKIRCLDQLGDSPTRAKGQNLLPINPCQKPKLPRDGLLNCDTLEFASLGVFRATPIHGAAGQTPHCLNRSSEVATQAARANSGPA